MSDVEEESGVAEEEDDEQPAVQGALISPTAKSSLLWGLVGGFSFLVLIQGYELLTDQGVSLGVKFGMAVVVAVGAVILTYVAESQVADG